MAMSHSDSEASLRLEQSIRRFQQKRLGLFIHWGPVILKGTEIGWSRDKEVPSAEYDQLFTRFNPVRFDAGEWVRTARSAGMRYIVITAKHHDGFCLWPSAHTDYHIGNTPFRRDVLGELSRACRDRGIEFSVYYSICDWHHPDYPLDSPGGRVEKPAPHDMPRYCAYMKSQMLELIERYGPLGLIWFDGDWEAPWTEEYGDDLYDFLKGLQPKLVVNNRISKARRGLEGTTAPSAHRSGDYDTPEQRVGAFSRQRPWETCMTLCRQWAWKPGDEMKSLEECLRVLVSAAGGDGNLLLNVGPMPDGRIEPRQMERLLEIGAWLKEYGRGIYGTRGGPFKPGAWGASTCREERIFLFLLEHPDAGLLRLPAIPAEVIGASLPGGGRPAVQSAPGVLGIQLPDDLSGDPFLVVELELDRDAETLEPVDVG